MTSSRQALYQPSIGSCYQCIKYNCICHLTTPNDLRCIQCHNRDEECKVRISFLRIAWASILMMNKWPVASEDEKMDEEKPSVPDMPQFEAWSRKSHLDFAVDLMDHMSRHGDDGTTWNAMLDFFIDITHLTEDRVAKRNQYLKLLSDISVLAKNVESDYVERSDLSFEVANLKAELAAIMSKSAARVTEETISSRKRPRGH